jgi:hypothetical protein
LNPAPAHASAKRQAAAAIAPDISGMMASSFFYHFQTGEFTHEP